MKDLSLITAENIIKNNIKYNANDVNEYCNDLLNDFKIIGEYLNTEYMLNEVIYKGKQLKFPYEFYHENYYNDLSELYDNVKLEYLFHEAIVSNRYDIVKYLFENYELDKLYERKNTESAIRWAINNDSLEIIKYLYEVCECDFTYLNENEEMIKRILYRDVVDILQYLIEENIIEFQQDIMLDYSEIKTTKYLYEKFKQQIPIADLKHILMFKAQENKIDVLKYFHEEHNIEINFISHAFYYNLEILKYIVMNSTFTLQELDTVIQSLKNLNEFNIIGIKVEKNLEYLEEFREHITKIK
jgi:hypothetical protein